MLSTPTRRPAEIVKEKFISSAMATSTSRLALSQSKIVCWSGTGTESWTESAHSGSDSEYESESVSEVARIVSNGRDVHQVDTRGCQTSAIVFFSFETFNDVVTRRRQTMLSTFVLYSYCMNSATCQTKSTRQFNVFLALYVDATTEQQREQRLCNTLKDNLQHS